MYQVSSFLHLFSFSCSFGIIPLFESSVKIFSAKKGLQNLSFAILSVSINLSTLWQTRKKEGKSVQDKLVGVRWYGRD